MFTGKIGHPRRIRGRWPVLTLVLQRYSYHHTGGVSIGVLINKTI